MTNVSGIDGFAELTLQTRDPGGDRSLYFSDPEGNRVEAWDFFERPEHQATGVEALRG